MQQFKRDKVYMTKDENHLLELFRLLDKNEREIIIGKTSELLYNRKQKKLDFSENEKVKYYPVVYLFFIKE